MKAVFAILGLALVYAFLQANTLFNPPVLSNAPEPTPGVYNCTDK